MQLLLVLEGSGADGNGSGQAGSVPVACLEQPMPVISLLCDRHCCLGQGASQKASCIRKACKGEPGSGGLLDLFQLRRSLLFIPHPLICFFAFFLPESPFGLGCDSFAHLYICFFANV